MAAAVSCTKEIVSVDEPVATSREGYVQITLSAGTDQATKAVLDGNTVLWSVGDEVAVYPGTATSPEKFTVKTVEGSSVTITGSVPEGTTSVVAVYPYDLAEGRDGNSVVFYVPETQDIPAGGTVNPYALVSAAVYTDIETPAVFKNLFSIVAMNPGAVDNASVLGIFAAGETAALAGEFTATLSADADPVIAPIDGCTETGVELFADTVFDANTTYYAVLAPGTIEGFTTGMGCENKIGMVDSEKTISLERNKGVNLGNISGRLTWKYSEIRTVPELEDFLATTDVYTVDDLVRLGNDLDLSRTVIKTAPSAFAGYFDGQDHSLKNWTCAGAPLFSKVTGNIYNLIIDSSCSLTAADPGNTGFIAKNLEGVMENCHNRGAVNITLESNDTVNDSGEDLEGDEIGSIQGRRIGALVGRMTLHSAKMIDCSNSGNVTVNVNISKAMGGAQYIGGLVGLVGDPGEEVVTRLEGCTNKGNVKVTVKSADNSQAWLKSHFIGGVAGGTGVNYGSSSEQTGFTKYYGDIKKCVNEGSVSAAWGGGTGGYFKVGGVLGYSEAALFSCVNKGEVSYVNSDEVANAGPSVGGVSAVLAGKAPVNAKDCVNEGSVLMSGMFSNAGSAYASGVAGFTWATCGGCFGTVGDNATLVQNCDNKGQVNVYGKMAATAGSQSAFGGVIGVSSADVKDCDNLSTKLCTLSGMTKNCHLAGVIGNAYKVVSNCQLSAPMSMIFNIETLTTNQASCFNNVGGIVGYAQDGSSISDCTVAGSASLKVSSNGELRCGGIVGMSYAPVSGCTNSAPITIDRNKDIDVAYVSYMGGVIGYQNADKPISKCENKAKIKVTLDNDSKYSHLAGVVGNAKSTLIENCSNAGEIVFDGAKMVKQMCVCGIVGTYAASAAVTIKSCSNSGNITVSNWENASYNYIAGISGSYTKGGNTYVDLSNTGNITSTAKSKMRVAGIGASINGSETTGCTNTGSISASNCLASSQIGGIAGYWGNGPMTKASSSGAVTCDSAESQSCAGGLVGALNVDSSWTDISSTGSVTADSGFYAGAILGQFSAAGKTLTVNSPYTITSTVNGAAYSGDNAAGFLNEGAVVFAD